MASNSLSVTPGPRFDASAFIVERLPSLNNAVIRGDLTPLEFVEAVREHVTALVAAAAQACLDRDGARVLLLQLGMFLNSAERHARAAGKPPGDALRRFPGIDAALERLGRVGEHPPRDSAYSYWILNRAGYSFTGNPQEALFARTVAGTVEYVDGACRCLRFIASPKTPLASPEVVRYMQQAADLQELGYRLLGALGKTNPTTGTPAFSGEFFTFDFRTWLIDWPVAGRKWEGPSAANFAAFWEADIRLTPVSSFYRHYVEGRIHTLPGEEQERVRAAMSESSVENRLLTCLGLDVTQALDLNEETIGRLLTSTGLVPFVLALDRYVAVTSRWTKVHLALVRKKLEEPAAAHAGEKPPVDPNLGTGGGNWREELLKILEMRANPSFFMKLFRANKLVSQASSPERLDGRVS